MSAVIYSCRASLGFMVALLVDSVDKLLVTEANRKTNLCCYIESSGKYIKANLCHKHDFFFFSK